MSRSRLDPNQIMQTVFDESSGSLKTIPSEETSFSVELNADDGDSVEVRSMVIEQTMLSNVSASSDSSSASLNVLKMNSMFISVSSSSLDNTVVINVMASADDSVFHQVDTLSVSNVAPTNYKEKSSLPYKFIRLDVVHGSNSAGTVTAKVVAKG